MCFGIGNDDNTISNLCCYICYYSIGNKNDITYIFPDVMLIYEYVFQLSKMNLTLFVPVATENGNIRSDFPDNFNKTIFRPYFSIVTGVTTNCVEETAIDGYLKLYTEFKRLEAN